MDATVQAKIDELVAAALTAGAQPAEVVPALNQAYETAVFAAEGARTIPLPAMTNADLLLLINYLNDGVAVDDIREVYRGLRRAIVERNQPAFWRHLFMLCKAFRKQHPYLDNSE